MCGITGIIVKQGVPIADELKRRNNLIAHRGPDGEGFYNDGQVGFGHRRLAIIDLSNDGHQPMIYQDRLVITFNGEIYNYIEIREELKNEGFVFKSLSDTEVILAAYDKWGEGCVERFNGMWAFAIHDKKKNLVFCSRDRFGVKPFYYKLEKGQFSFGSEIKQLLELNNKNKAHKDLIAHYLFTGMHDFDDRTFFKDIHKLPPSHNLIFNVETHEFQLKQYFDLNSFKSDDYSYPDLLESSINLRLRSDVKVGTCLSGGLDSSTIAAIAAKNYNKNSDQKFNAIHARSIEKETDESYFAEKVAQAADLELNVIMPSPNDFKSIVNEVVYTQEEPFGSPSIYFQYFVMKKAKELGCKVMLDGQGGDETLLGYERYYAPAYMSYLKDEGLIEFIKELSLSNKNNSKMSFINIAKYIAGTYLIGIRQKYARFKNPWFKRTAIPLSFPYQELIKTSAFEISRMQEVEIFKTNLQALLRYEDKNSMRHGIEARLPFLDYRCVTKAIKLPLREKISQGWTKFILRKTCEKYLPSEVAWRKSKLGFNAPDRSWLEACSVDIRNTIDSSAILKEFISPDKITIPIGNSWVITWRIYNIALWERIYNVQV